MDDIKTAKDTAKPGVASAEVARRRRALRQADANNRLEGIFREPATDAIFEKHVRGEINSSEMMAQLRAMPQPR
jgi:Antitoxin VbhA